MGSDLYPQDMPCPTHGKYAQKHNFFVYFTLIEISLHTITLFSKPLESPLLAMK